LAFADGFQSGFPGGCHTKPLYRTDFLPPLHKKALSHNGIGGLISNIKLHMH
jgi:hypothetical protein